MNMEIEVRGAMHGDDDEVKRDQDHADTFNWSADILSASVRSTLSSFPRLAHSIFALRAQGGPRSAECSRAPLHSTTTAVTHPLDARGPSLRRATRRKS